MNMFANMMGNLIDKEAITRDTIGTTIEDLATEYECQKEEILIMIKPKKAEDDKMNEKFTCWVYKIEAVTNGGLVPMLKREIKLKEILGIDADTGE